MRLKLTLLPHAFSTLRLWHEVHRCKHPIDECRPNRSLTKGDGYIAHQGHEGATLHGDDFHIPSRGHGSHDGHSIPAGA